MKFKNSLIISLIAHILILSLPFLPKFSCGRGGVDNNQTDNLSGDTNEEQIREKGEKITEITIIESKEGITKKKDRKGTECEGDKWFGGIGIEMGYLEEGFLVSKVYKGYPADKAGLKEWDVLYVSEEIRGKPGTYFSGIVKRNGKSFKMSFIRDKICTLGKIE